MDSRLVVYTAVLVLCGVIPALWPVPVSADDPPPTPTLAPVIGSTTSATQTLQLQEFLRPLGYQLGHTVAYTATVGGATWVVERSFSYGEASVTIIGMALVLMQVLSLSYRVVTRER
jgi:hypothetical protein